MSRSRSYEKPRQHARDFMHVGREADAVRMELLDGEIEYEDHATDSRSRLVRGRLIYEGPFAHVVMMCRVRATYNRGRRRSAARRLRAFARRMSLVAHVVWLPRYERLRWRLLALDRDATLDPTTYCFSCKNVVRNWNEHECSRGRD